MTVITGARGKKTFISVNFYVILSISVILLGLYQLWSNISRGTSPVIVVPGGGLTSEGKVPVWTQLRLDEAVKLYKANAKRRPIIITLSAGTPHKPNPLDSKGFAIWEAAAAAKRLIEMGIPPESVYEENISLDTIGNVSQLNRRSVPDVVVRHMIKRSSSDHSCYHIPYIGIFLEECSYRSS